MTLIENISHIWLWWIHSVHMTFRHMLIDMTLWPIRHIHVQHLSYAVSVVECLVTVSCLFKRFTFTTVTYTLHRLVQCVRPKYLVARRHMSRCPKAHRLCSKSGQVLMPKCSRWRPERHTAAAEAGPVLPLSTTINAEPPAGSYTAASGHLAVYPPTRGHS